MKMKLTATILLIAGSATFVVGAFLPVSRVYVLRTPEERLGVMQDQSALWKVHLGMMGGGAAISAAGLLLLPAALSGGAVLPAGAAAVLASTGTVLWGRHLQLRVKDPAGFAHRTNPIWHFALYTLLMQVALLSFALALWRAGYPVWMPAVLAGGTLLTILMFAAIRDVPPFLHYVWLLAVAVGLWLAIRSPSVTAAEPHVVQSAVDSA